MTEAVARCPHRRVIEVGYRVERDVRQAGGGMSRRCYVIARCRDCGAKLLQAYDMRRFGDWVVASDETAGPVDPS